MDSKGKTLALILTIVFAISCLTLPTVKPVNAQTIPTPSVPEFAVKVNSTALQVVIRNQAFTPYVSNGQNITLCFDLRVKRAADQFYSAMYSPDTFYPTQSNSDYTTLTYIPIRKENNSGFVFGMSTELATPNSNVSFEVEAMIGSIYHNSGHGDNMFNGTVSGWSSPQTVTIPAVIKPVTPTAILLTEPFTFSDFILLIGAVAVLVVVILLSLLLLLRHRKTANLKQ